MARWQTSAYHPSMFRPPALLYAILAVVFFVGAVVEYLRGDMKNVMPLVVVGAVGVILTIWRLLLRRRNAKGS